MKFSLPPHWHHINWATEETEKKVSHREMSYKDLPPLALYTSLEDLLVIFSQPEIEGTFVDLGCGSGKSCLLYGALFPERKAIGIEWEKSRIELGKKLTLEINVSNVELICQDLLEGNLPSGNVYFLYFPTGLVLDKVLHDLYLMDKDFILVAVESHGDLFDRLSLEAWLKLIKEIPLSAARHDPHARVYRKVRAERTPSFFDFSFREKFFFIQENNGAWLGESFGLEWLAHDLINLKTPPRTISWSTVTKVLSWEELGPELRSIVQLRRLGEITIETDSQSFAGIIRKIMVAPSFELEISTGEKVEWKSIKTIRKGNLLCYASS